MYNLEDLLAIYADQNYITVDEAFEQYGSGLITKCELLAAYLEDEGIFGYTSALWSIFKTLGGTNNKEENV